MKREWKFFAQRKKLAKKVQLLREIVLETSLGFVEKERKFQMKRSEKT